MAPQSSPIAQAAKLRRRWSKRADVTVAEWPNDAWNNLRAAGVTRWTVPRDFGGDGLDAEPLLAGCIELARGNLLVTFILSQYQAACQRIAASPSVELRRRWLPRLATGVCFGTVGISHLTTSRQHSTQPVVSAESTATGYRLTGEIPWVTGSRRANALVIGGTLSDGRQLIAAVPSRRTGITIAEPLPLLALSGSETGPIRLDGVEIAHGELIAGPAPQVLQTMPTGGAGSLTTSALAIGHAWGCLDRLAIKAQSRPELQSTLTALHHDADELQRDLLNTAAGRAGPEHNSAALRTRATELALRASQALLTACKGAGFVAGHPAERLAREALFFLVWSCPQNVATQLLQGFSACTDDAK
jgi:alkylation response protein AidB-like acyl-CoA dehydrogenase